MKTQITLDGKEVKTIIAKALKISEDQVIDLGVSMVDNRCQ